MTKQTVSVRKEYHESMHKQGHSNKNKHTANKEEE